MLGVVSLSCYYELAKGLADLWDGVLQQSIVWFIWSRRPPKDRKFHGIAILDECSHLNIWGRVLLYE